MIDNPFADKVAQKQFTEELRKMELSTTKEWKLAPASSKVYLGKSELDRAKDNLSKELRRHIFSSACDQIEEFFLLVLRNEENLIKPLLTSQKYLGLDEVKKWKEITDLKFRYSFNQYLNLAKRLSEDNSTFLIQNEVSDEIAIRFLMKLFESIIPIEWGREIKAVTPKPKQMLLQNIETPTTTNVTSDQTATNTEDVIGRIDFDEELRAESSITNQTPRTIVTRSMEYSSVEKTPNYYSRNTSKRKRDSTAGASISISEPTLKKGKGNTQETPTNNIDQRHHITHIANEVKQLFHLGTNTSKLAENKKVSALLYTILINNEDKEDILCGKRIWNFYLPNEVMSGASVVDIGIGDMSFVRAHYRIYEKLVGNASSIQPTDQELVQVLQSEVLKYEDGKFKKFKDKVNSLYKRVILNEEEEQENNFSEEDFCLPFLHPHLSTYTTIAKKVLNFIQDLR